MEAPFIVIPVIVPVLDVFEFQFVISDDVIPAATEAENTGSVSVSIYPLSFVRSLVLEGIEVLAGKAPTSAAV